MSVRKWVTPAHDNNGIDLFIEAEPTGLVSFGVGSGGKKGTHLRFNHKDARWFGQHILDAAAEAEDVLERRKTKMDDPDGQE